MNIPGFSMTLGPVVRMGDNSKANKTGVKKEKVDHQPAQKSTYSDPSGTTVHLSEVKTIHHPKDTYGQSTN